MERTRLYFIDNLRILLITLVIMMHLSVTYGGAGGFGGWLYKEGKPDMISFSVLTMFNAVNQAFFMGFLFMIAGYFTPGSYERKGPRLFIRGRLLRLGIPLLCYDFIINPLLFYLLMQAGAFEFDGSYPEFLSMYYSSFHIGTGPLWFVEVLLIFSVFYVLWRLFAKTPACSFREGGKVPGNLAIAFLALALGAVTFIVRIWLPVSWRFEPLNLQFPFFPQYICMFVAGIVAYRLNWLVQIPDAMGKFWLSIAIVFILLCPVLFVLGGASNDISLYMGGVHWQCCAYSVWEQFMCVAIVIGLSVLFRERFNKWGRLTNVMSASSYTAYIIHGPVVVLVTLAMRNISLYPLLKFALAVLITVPLCFILGNFIKQLPLAKRIL